MDNKINIHIPSAELIEQAQHCHLVPFNVKYTGKADVSKYFEPVISESDGGCVTASFRGKPLIGDQIKLPEDYSGVVIEKQRNEDLDDQRFNVTRRFEQFTYWNWDKNPSDNDKIRQAMSWLHLSRAIHTNLEDDGTTAEDKS